MLVFWNLELELVVLWRRYICDFQLHDIEMEIQRKKEALKEDDRKRRNLARQVHITQSCEWQSVVSCLHQIKAFDAWWVIVIGPISFWRYSLGRVAWTSFKSPSN